MVNHLTLTLTAMVFGCFHGFSGVPSTGDQRRCNHRLKAIHLVILGLIANLACISPGMTLGFSAVAIPQMKSENATFRIDDDQASWMASLASVATAVGCLLSGSLTDRFGRRAAILGINIPGLVGWLLIAFAHGPYTLALVYAGRILTGLSTGMCSSTPSVYSAEISTDKVRGMMVTFTSLAVSLGILLVYILGAIFTHNWRLIAGMAAVFPVIAFTLGFIFLPESVSWLAVKGRHEEAAVVREKIHGTSLTAIKPTNGFLPARPKGSLLRAFLSISFIKPFLIMNVFFFFQQFSGIFVIVFYAVDIVIEAGIDFDPNLIAVLIGATRFFVTIVVSYMTNKYGRRPLAIISGAGMTLGMGSLAAYVYFQTTGFITEELGPSLSWVPVFCLTMYILTSTIGFLTLPWAMVGEVYPSRVRGTAAGLTTCLAYVYNFIIVKIYPSMAHSLDRYGLFFFYGIASLLGTIFVTLFLPETKGKNLGEIESQYKNNSKVISDVEEKYPLSTNENKIIVIPI